MEIVGLGQSDKWDGIVKSFPDHDVYYLSGYVKAFEFHGDGSPVLLYYSSEKGRAICVLFLRDISMDPLFEGKIPVGRYFDAVTPYGYGGFVFDGDVDKTDLKREFDYILKENRINSVFFRFHPILDNASENEAVTCVTPLGNTIAMDLTSPEVIWENIISKNRNMIRKAEKSGVEIHHSDDPELFRTFKEIYDETMRGDNAEDYYYFKEEFYDSVARDLKGNYQVFYATYKGIIISIAIMIYANDQMHYHLSGSLREYRSFAPSNLLLYRAALWGHEQGFRTFHLGGGVGSGEDPLYKFKAAFNRRSDCKFAIGRVITNREDYDYLMKLRGFTEVTASEIKYFPQYRAHIE